MRNTIFDAILNLLQGVQKLHSEVGQIHVYDYPVTAPAGYPYAVVGCKGVTSDELSNVQDYRTYLFAVQIVCEKFGDPASEKNQSEALRVIRTIEETVLNAFCAENALGLGLQIIVTRPINVEWNYTEDKTKVVLSFDVPVETAVNITL